MARAKKFKAKAFWALASEIITDKFLSICRDDESIAREAMEQFAKLCFPESEHKEIEEMGDERLRKLVAQLSFDDPEVFMSYLEVVREAAAEFFAQKETGQQQQSS